MDSTHKRIPGRKRCSLLTYPLNIQNQQITTRPGSAAAVLQMSDFLGVKGANSRQIIFRVEIHQVTCLKVFSGNQSSKYSKTAGHDLFEILPETSLLGPPDTFICFSTRSPGKEFKRSVCKNYTGVCSRRQEGVAIVAYWYRTVSSIVTYWHHTVLSIAMI